MGGIALDSEGNLYFSDSRFDADLGQPNLVRRIDRNGIIITVAGTGEPGFRGDGGTAIEAELNKPAGVAIDSEGNLYIADGRNHRIRKVTFE